MALIFHCVFEAGADGIGFRLDPEGLPDGAAGVSGRSFWDLRAGRRSAPEGGLNGFAWLYGEFAWR
jgi:hypothetical protein